MIATPQKSTSFLDELYNEKLTIEQVFKSHPREIDDFFKEVPWFFFEKKDLTTLENLNQNFKLSDSAKRWNEIKLDIYHTFYGKSFFEKPTPTKADWEYFIHFNTNQNKKSKLHSNAYPSTLNSDTYWISETVKDLFGDYNISEAYKNAPKTIDRLLCFDNALFFDDEVILQLTNLNPEYKLSNKALLWNSEKYNFWLERREEEVRNSRPDWESRQDNHFFSATENSNTNDESYFNAMTDGQLGNFDNFSGDLDDIDNWANG
jgi:hypothetical protein